MSLSMHWTTGEHGNFLDRAKPEIVAKHSGLWVCVSEYGIILNCAKTKEDLERAIIPHHGCANQYCRVP